jgi:hypothetical protein
MDGEVDVVSRPGRTVFTLRLPLAVGAERREAALTR